MLRLLLQQWCNIDKSAGAWRACSKYLKSFLYWLPERLGCFAQGV
jgi:hypothetical protein